MNTTPPVYTVEGPERTPVTEGMRVRQVQGKPIMDLGEFGKGMLGTVREVTDGCIWVRLDKHVPALDDWENEIAVAVEDDPEPQHSDCGPSVTRAFWHYFELLAGEEFDFAHPFTGHDLDRLAYLEDLPGVNVWHDGRVRVIAEARFEDGIEGDARRLVLMFADESHVEREFSLDRLWVPVDPPPVKETPAAARHILAVGESVDVVVDGHTVRVGHFTTPDGEHGLSVAGVGCDLDGEEPGTYYPKPSA